MKVKEKAEDSVILIILVVILILVYARAFFQRPSRKRRMSKPPVAEVEKTKGKEELEEIESLLKIEESQEWGRSPFMLPDEPTVDLREEEKLLLAGITWREGKALALIGDRMVREGDTINGKRVAKIKRDSVILRQGKKEYILMFDKEGRP